MPWQDGERDETVITKVEGDSASGWWITRDDGWTCAVRGEYGVVPAVGDTLVTWGGLGRVIRGMALNGRVLFYRTPAEQRAEDQRQADQYKAERIAAYEGQRFAYDARVSALPAPLRERVEGFRARGGDAWRWSNEPYELACCEEAARLDAHFATDADLLTFAQLGYDEQKAAYPQMDDGHSGNTWGMSIRLARLLKSRPETVSREHAAFCGLAGCKDSACWSTTDEAKAS